MMVCDHAVQAICVPEHQILGTRMNGRFIHSLRKLVHCEMERVKQKWSSAFNLELHSHSLPPPDLLCNPDVRQLRHRHVGAPRLGVELLQAARK
eukprot:2125786-Rhodomonas_salina.1